MRRLLVTGCGCYEEPGRRVVAGRELSGPGILDTMSDTEEVVSHYMALLGESQER